MTVRRSAAMGAGLVGFSPASRRLFALSHAQSATIGRRRTLRRPPPRAGWRRLRQDVGDHAEDRVSHCPQEASAVQDRRDHLHQQSGKGNARARGQVDQRRRRRGAHGQHLSRAGLEIPADGTRARRPAQGLFGARRRRQRRHHQGAFAQGREARRAVWHPQPGQSRQECRPVARGGHGRRAQPA